MTNGKKIYKLQKKYILRPDQKERTESVSLIMLLGRAFQWEGAIYLKAQWPYHFVLVYNPWAKKQQKMIHSPIKENKMECMAE